MKDESFVLWQKVIGGIQTSWPYLTFAFTYTWTGRQYIVKELGCGHLPIGPAALISFPVSCTYVIKLILSLNWLEFTACNNVGTGEKLLAFLFLQDAYGRFSVFWAAFAWHTTTWNIVQYFLSLSASFCFVMADLSKANCQYHFHSTFHVNASSIYMF